ncbi:MAG: nucleotide exchange factor GrpE [Cyanosarcina radialis HA8281-LM2]|jgi:molecular chaperone GrpE (heat shock protein)|nr:nucleotide exchange factor GrpE [Cyanosarcina radialis HA8281-LM2]
MRSDRSHSVNEFKKLFPNYAAGILLLLAAIAVFLLGLFPHSTTDDRFVIAAILFVGACVLLAWTHQQNIEHSYLESLPKSIDEIKKVGREYYKNTAAIQDNSVFVKELYEKIDRSDNGLIELRKYLEELLIKQRQENGNLQRKIESWQTAAIGFFQMLERAIDYEKKEKNKRLLEKIITEFERSLMNLGLERIIPQVNEPINEIFHEVVDEIESNEVVSGTILKCYSWGYRIGDTVLDRAQVALAQSLEDREPAILPAESQAEENESIAAANELEITGQ